MPVTWAVTIEPIDISENRVRVIHTRDDGAGGIWTHVSDPLTVQVAALPAMRANLQTTVVTAYEKHETGQALVAARIPGWESALTSDIQTWENSRG